MRTNSQDACEQHILVLRDFLRPSLCLGLGLPLSLRGGLSLSLSLSLGLGSSLRTGFRAGLRLAASTGFCVLLRLLSLSAFLWLLLIISFGFLIGFLLSGGSSLLLPRNPQSFAQKLMCPLQFLFCDCLVLRACLCSPRLHPQTKPVTILPTKCTAAWPFSRSVFVISLMWSRAMSSSRSGGAGAKDLPMPGSGS